MPKISVNSKLKDKREITAFVQQQLTELAPHLAEATALELTLSESNLGFQAALTLSEDEGPVQMIGRSEDLFQAIKIAKEGLLEYCVELEAEFQPHLRSDKISRILNQKSHWIH